MDISNPDDTTNFIILPDEKDNITTTDFIPRLNTVVVRIIEGDKVIWTSKNEYESILSAVTYADEDDEVELVKIHRNGPTGKVFIYYGKNGNDWAILDSEIAADRINKLSDSYITYNLIYLFIITTTITIYSNA